MTERDVADFERRLAAQGYPESMRSGHVARAIGVSRQTVMTLRSDGQIDAMLVNKEYRYSRTDVARFMAMGRSIRGHHDSR